MLKLFGWLQSHVDASELALARILEKNLVSPVSSRIFYFQLIWQNIVLIIYQLAADLLKFVIIMTSDSSVGFNILFRQQEKTVCPFSYAYYRQLRQKVRVFSLVGLASLVAVAVTTSLITNLLFGGKLPSFAASFGWTQNDWSQGPDPTGKANHLTNQALPNYWKYFASSSLVRILTNGQLTLATTTLAITSTNFTASGSNIYLVNGFPRQKMLDNARCTTTTECLGGACSEDFDNIAQKYCHASSTSCIDWVSNTVNPEFTNNFIHCSGNSYSKTCNNGTWGATATITGYVCTPSSGPNDGLTSGGWASANCTEGIGFSAIMCNSCSIGYAASTTSGGCYTSCSSSTQCLKWYSCISGGCTPTPCYGSELAGDFCTFNGIKYGIVNAGGQLWLDRNLGATRVPVSATDSQGYGWYYQWGRASDGHQLASSTVTAVRSVTRNPGHNNFISTGLDVDWSTSGIYNTWLGWNAINNPCPPGYRLPSITEWSGLNYTWSNAYTSPLKLPYAGWRDLNGSFNGLGGAMQYPAGTGDASGMDKMYMVSNFEAFQHQKNFSDGYPVRCVKN